MHHQFGAEQEHRATQLISQLQAQRITKYNTGEDYSHQLPVDRTVVLVPGQVEDDASMNAAALVFAEILTYFTLLVNYILMPQ